jgi:plasmid stabilization system protein ParE
MSRWLIVRPEAESDIVSAAEWYDEQRPGLSLEFRSALDQTLLAIKENPELYARVYHDLRRALLHRFPYGVFYVQRAEGVIVAAVLHTSRSARLWRTRRSGEN